MALIPDIVPLAGVDNTNRLQAGITAAIQTGKKRYVVGKGDGDGVWRLDGLINIGYGFDGFRLIFEPGTLVVSPTPGAIVMTVGWNAASGAPSPGTLRGWPNYVDLADVLEGATQATVTGTGGAGVAAGDDCILVDMTQTWGGSVYGGEYRNSEWVKVESVAGGVVTFAPNASLYGPQELHPMNPVPKHGAGRDYLNAYEVEMKLTNATGGTFILGLDGQQTPELPYDVSAADMQTALRVINPAVIVTQAFPVWRVTIPDNANAHSLTFGITNTMFSGGQGDTQDKLVRPAKSVRLVKVPPEYITRNFSLEGFTGDLGTVNGGTSMGTKALLAVMVRNLSVWRFDLKRFMNKSIDLQLCQDFTVHDSQLDGVGSNGAGNGYGHNPRRCRHGLFSKCSDGKRAMPVGALGIRHAIITHGCTDIWHVDCPASSVDSHGQDDRRLVYKGVTGQINNGNQSFLDGAKDVFIDSTNSTIVLGGKIRNLWVQKVTVNTGTNFGVFNIASAPDQYPTGIVVGTASGARSVLNVGADFFKNDTSGATTKAKWGQIDLLFQNFTYTGRGCFMKLFSQSSTIKLKNFDMSANAPYFDSSVYIAGFKPDIFMWAGCHLTLEDGTFTAWKGGGSVDNTFIGVQGAAHGNPITGSVTINNVAASGVTGFGGLYNESPDTVPVTKNNFTVNGVLQ